MKKSAITSELKLRIETLAMDAAFPNVKPDAGLSAPYLNVTFATSRRESDDLSGILFREVGVMSVTVVAKEGSGTTTAENYADDVADLFPIGLRLPITGGTITITGPADIKEGFQGTADWRVPVLISYEANKNASA